MKKWLPKVLFWCWLQTRNLRQFFFSSMEFSINSIFLITEWHFIKESLLKCVYIDKDLKILCKESTFKKSLIKVTKEPVLSVNNSLIKQIYVFLMGVPISIVFSNMYMCKMENEVVKPLKPIFYKRYVGDTYAKSKRDETDLLLILNTYHPNIKLFVKSVQIGVADFN